MKNLICLAVIILFAYSCKEIDVPQYAIIQGIIENPESDSLNILTKDRTILSTIKLTENNRFADTIQKPDGCYYLSHGNRFAQIYLQPNFQVELSFDGRSVEEPITFNGNGHMKTAIYPKRQYFRKNYKQRQILATI